MNRIRLAPRRYRTTTAVTVGRFHGSQFLECQEIAPGGEFEIPRSVNGHWHAAIYYPEFGDAQPEFSAVG